MKSERSISRPSCQPVLPSSVMKDFRYGKLDENILPVGIFYNDHCIVCKLYIAHNEEACYCRLLVGAARFPACVGQGTDDLGAKRATQYRTTLLQFLNPLEI
jgi:hypothetical protein